MTGHTDVVCKVCKKGIIYSEVWEEGSVPTKHSVSKHYCNVCGVRYEFVPEQKLRDPIPNQTSRTSAIVTSSTPIPDYIKTAIAENLERGRQAAEYIKNR